MTCPVCNGKRRPCSACGGFRIGIGPCASAAEQARQDTTIRMIGVRTEPDETPRWLDVEDLPYHGGGVMEAEVMDFLVILPGILVGCYLVRLAAAPAAQRARAPPPPIRSAAPATSTGGHR